MWKIITLPKISVANKEMRSVNCKLILKISSVWRAKLLYKGATISGNWLGMSSLGKRQCRNEQVGGKRQRENPDTIVAQTYCLTKTSQGLPCWWWWSVIIDQWSSRSYKFQISIMGIWYQIYLSYLHLMWVSKAISTKCISTILGQSP